MELSYIDQHESVQFLIQLKKGNINNEQKPAIVQDNHGFPTHIYVLIMFYCFKINLVKLHFCTLICSDRGGMYYLE